MLDYREELEKRNEDLKCKIQASKKVLRHLKEELKEKEKEKELFTFSDKSVSHGSVVTWDEAVGNFYMESKLNIAKSSFPIKVETSNKTFEITEEDIIKLRALLDRKPWYKRIWTNIQKIWKRRTKS